MTREEFKTEFQRLTGNPPLSWQIRIWEQHFITNALPEIIDLPTGLGKTMVMAIWLIARMQPGSNLPRRLIYVVDRRTVVDQATDLAEQLQSNFGEDKLAISTLRGQLADNREWSRDPSHPAIIIGTVDLIGSALLFSGYRSSYKRRPLEAGLLGQDSLLVLDEAHLSKPFEKLICAINDTGKFQKDREGKLHGSPLRVIRMSATSGGLTNGTPFTLELDDDGNLFGEDASDKTIDKRFTALKTLSIEDADKLTEALAIQADKLAKIKPGSRIVIFVRTPKQVADVGKELERKNKVYAARVAQLTGTMRGLERDELVSTKKPPGDNEQKWRVMRRFLEPDNDPAQGECFLITTSAGEVGFDLNADHMVCDATTIDSFIQRLGRVNRRGEGNATVVLVRERSKTKDGKLAELKGFDLAVANTLKLLEGIKDKSVSPKSIVALKAAEWKKHYAAACVPEIATVELTDILLDNWSTTSVVEPMPAKPPVEAWLRGVAEWEPPQTKITWRSELDLDGFGDLEMSDIEEWFDTHRILTREALTANTSDAVTWFKDRWAALSDEQQRKVGDRSVVIDRGGMELVSLREVLNRLERKAETFLRGAEIIVPASFGGIERHQGILNPEAPRAPEDTKDAADQVRQANAAARLIAPDVADVRDRYRETVAKSEDGESIFTALDPAAGKPHNRARFAIRLQSDDDKTVTLTSYVPKIERPDMGSDAQTLEGHVTDVRNRAIAILSDLGLKEDNPIRLAVQLAAYWHDHGKNRELFQDVVGGTPSDSARPWPDHVMGKSGGIDRGKPRRNYRHEFGSLREFADAFISGKLPDNASKPITQEVFDLAMHLIATHHGRGRPHFPKGGFDPLAEGRSDEIHIASIQRFARLQRLYGWWYLAWLENLLRCPDALASETPTTGKIPMLKKAANEQS